MTKWLPPRSPAHRAARGDDWDDAEWMAWDSNKELRQIVVGLANMFREKGTPALDVEFLWTPRSPRDPASTSDEEATEDAEIRADMAVLPGWAPGSDTQ